MVIKGKQDPLGDRKTLKRIEQSIQRGVFTSLHTRLDCDSETIQRLVDIGLHKLVIEVDPEAKRAREAARQLCRIRQDRPLVRLLVPRNIESGHLDQWLELADQGGIEEVKLEPARSGQPDTKQLNPSLASLLVPLTARAPWRRPRLLATDTDIKHLKRLHSAEISEKAPIERAPTSKTVGQSDTQQRGLRFAQDLPRFSVVVPTHHGSKPWLGKCLATIARLSGPVPEVIVVIDGPAPDLAGLIRKHLPAARQLRLASNRGFAGAANAGMRSARGELVALINDDTELDPRWLEAMDRAADTHRDAGSFASRVLQLGSPDRIDSAGHGLCRWGEAFEIGAGASDGPEFDNDKWVFGAPASASVYRRELLNDCGGFDDSMEAYLEDVELSLRAQLLGYPCLYVSGARVWHRGSSSYGTQSAHKAHLLARNRIHLMLRSMPHETLRSSGAAIAVSMMAGLGHQLLSGAAPLATALGTLAGLQNAEDSLAQRPEALGRRRVDNVWMRAVLRNSENRLLELSERPMVGQWRRRRATLSRTLRSMVDRNEIRMGCHRQEGG